MSISVTKRNGKVEPFSVAKIKQAISWACEGFEVNPLELESKFDEFVKDKMNTSALHDNLIYQAQSLASGQDPDWVFVAGRLQTMKRWKETNAYEYDFKDYLNRQHHLGYYKHPAIFEYTVEEIEELGKCIKQENDLTHSYGSIITAEKKYLLPGECIQQMFMVNAMIIASIETSNKLDLVKTIYTKLSERKISLATPWLSNLRSNGNISSCFIIAVDDSIDSITDNWKNAALISKLGGGLGIDLSRIRAKGATIAGVKDASGGICGWAKTFNEIAVNVDQCFHEDTLVTTENGEIYIKDLRINDNVLTHDGSYQSIEDVLSIDNKDHISYKVKLDNNESAIVTESHPVLVVKGEYTNKSDNEIISCLENGTLYYVWKDVKDLLPGDKIIGY